jgi:hypothetical protein
MSGNTSNGPKPSPLLKAAHLWAKSSVKGGQYLTGRWGALKVLVMENRDRKSDDDPSHILFFTEAPDRRQDAGERAQERSGGAGATHPLRTPQNASAAHRPSFPGHRSGVPGHRDPVPDHQAPLDRDGPPPARDVLDDAPEWAR